MATDSNIFQNPCVPKFDGDYDHWSLIMENLLRSNEFWSVIEEGYTEPKSRTQLTASQQKTLDEAKLKDLKARNYLFQALDKTILKTITQKDTAKQLWDSMKAKYQGSARVKRAQLQRLHREFETLEMKVGESVTDYFARVMIVANDMRNCGEDMDDVKIVEKILRTMTENFNFVVCSIEESKDIDKLTVDELQSSLLIHEQNVRCHESNEQVLKVEHDLVSVVEEEEEEEVIVDEGEEEAEADWTSINPLLNATGATNLDISNMSVLAGKETQITLSSMKGGTCY